MAIRVAINHKTEYRYDRHGKSVASYRSSASSSPYPYPDTGLFA